MFKFRLMLAALSLVTLLVPLTISAHPTAAAPYEQIGTPGPTPTATQPIPISTLVTPEIGDPGPQIILVMDISGSMEARVFPEDVPEDVAALQSQLKELEESEDVRTLYAEAEEIEKSSEFIAAQDVVDEAYLAVEEYFPSHGLKSAQAVTSQLEILMAEANCPTTENAYLIVTAENIQSINSQLNTDCGFDLDLELRAEMLALLAYIADPEYAELIEAYYDASDAQRQLLLSTGYYDALNQAGNLLVSRGYNDTYDQLQARAVELGYPTRLELAKAAASTLIDLSRLDDVSGGYQTHIGLVIFSNSARVLTPLTEDFEAVDSSVQLLYPYGLTNISSGLALALENFPVTNDPDRPALIVLLSDGQPSTGFGLTSDQILARVAPQISDAGVEVCTAGFATTEDEIDVELMEQLATRTDGEYGFARTGEELIGFFVRCRQSLLDEIASTLAGSAFTGEVSEAGSFEVPENTGEVKVTLNWLEGNLELVLIDPSGQEITEGSAGYTTQRDDNLQLTIITDPAPGTWSARVRSIESPEKGSLFNILVSLTERQQPTPTPTPEPTAIPTEDPSTGIFGGLTPFIIGGCLCLTLLIVPIGGGVLFFLRRRQSTDMSAAPSSSPSQPPTRSPSATDIEGILNPPPAASAVIHTSDDEPPLETEQMPILNEASPDTEEKPSPAIPSDQKEAYDPNATLISSKRRTAQKDEPPELNSDLNETIVHKPKKPDDEQS